jgi:hypothetical protein
MPLTNALTKRHLSTQKAHKPHFHDNCIVDPSFLANPPSGWNQNPGQLGFVGVATIDNVLALGCPGNTTQPNYGGDQYSGQVVLYRLTTDPSNYKTTSTILHILDNPAVNDASIYNRQAHFGKQVALTEAGGYMWLIVAAPNHGLQAGTTGNSPKIYIYRSSDKFATAPTVYQTITPWSAFGSDYARMQYKHQMDAHNDYFVVGSQEYNNGTGITKLYQLQSGTWTQVQYRTNSYSDQWSGWAVSCQANTRDSNLAQYGYGAPIGARVNPPSNLGNQGVVQTFFANSNGLRTAIAGPNASDNLGSGFAMNYDTIAYSWAGADYNSQTDVGRVYIVQHGGLGRATLDHPHADDHTNLNYISLRHIYSDHQGSGTSNPGKYLVHWDTIEQDWNLYALYDELGRCLGTWNRPGADPNQFPSYGTNEWDWSEEAAISADYMVLTSYQLGTQRRRAHVFRLSPLPIFNITVTNIGNAYRMTGSDRNGTINSNTNNPQLNFAVGDQINFTIDSNTYNSHPFYIKNFPSSGSSNQVTNPSATGNGTTSISWTPTSARTAYYQCSVHYGMYRQIIVS